MTDDNALPIFSFYVYKHKHNLNTQGAKHDHG